MDVLVDNLMNVRKWLKADRAKQHFGSRAMVDQAITLFYKEWPK